MCTIHLATRNTLGNVQGAIQCISGLMTCLMVFHPGGLDWASPPTCIRLRPNLTFSIATKVHMHTAHCSAQWP